MGSVLSKFKVFTRKLLRQPKPAPVSSLVAQGEVTPERFNSDTPGPKMPGAIQLQPIVRPNTPPETTSSPGITHAMTPVMPTTDLVAEMLNEGLLSQPDSDTDTPQSAATLPIEPGLDSLTAVHGNATLRLALQSAEIPETTTYNAHSLWSQALGRLRKKGLDDLDCSEDANIQLFHKLIEETQAKKEECDDDRLSYIDSRGEKVFYAEAFLSQLNKYVAIGDIAIQHNPDVVALAWAGFRLLLQVGTAYTENMAMISSSLGYLVSVMCCGEIYERLYCKTELKAVEQLTGCLVDLYVSVLEYLLCAKKYLHKNTMVRIVESFSSKLIRILEDIQRYERTTRERADIAEKEAAFTARSKLDTRTQELRDQLAEIQGQMTGIEETVVNCHKRIQGLCDFVDNRIRLDTLDWVSKVEYGSHHSQHSVRRIPDTGDWLLENQKFHEWVSGTSEAILWLRGDAGSGKTMLASKVIDLLNNEKASNGYAVAFFYCYYQERERYMPASILRAIVKQLCVAFSEDGLPKCLTDIYDERQKEGNSTGSLKIDESKQLIIDLSKRFIRTTIVIDALDECDSDTRRDLFDSLTHITKAGNCIRIFVTGRSEGDIRDGLLGSPDHYINARDNSKDIKIYINCELGKLSQRRPLLAPMLEQSKEVIIERLESGAEGMFMWVHLRMQAIHRETTFPGVLQALGEFPADINKTYSNILTRITRQSKTDSRGAQNVLRWLAYAHGACSPETVSQALLVTSSMMAPDTEYSMERSQIIDICRNLVVYDEKLQVLRFAHYSVKEFLETLDEYDEKQGNTWISEICLKVLNSRHYWGPQLLSSPAPQLLSYAVQNWAGHLKESDCERTDLKNLWSCFLTVSSDYYKRWTSVISSSSEHSALHNGGEPIHPLWVACYFQLDKIFKHLLENGAVPDCYNHARQTPLHFAAEHGYEKYVSHLIGRPDVEINSKDNSDFTPLIRAASNGHTAVVRLLLQDNQVDVNCKDYHGDTALIHAAWCGHTEIVKTLLKRDEVLVNVRDADGDTALISATIKGHHDIVTLLLGTIGVEANCKNNGGNTALSMAVMHSHDNIVQNLLGRDGVEMDCVNNNGETPLLLAAQRGQDDVVRRLLTKGDVNVNYTNNGRSSLSLAVEGCHEQVAQSLLSYQADLNYVDISGYTPLLRAVENNDTSIVKLLLSWPGLDVNYQLWDGFTALSKAVWRGHEDIVKLLVEKEGVNQNHKDRDGDTPLALAIWKGNEESARALLAKESVDINLQNDAGDTPLLSAVRRGQVSLVEILLENQGVDINRPSNNSMTPLRYAVDIGHTKIVQLLLNHDCIKVVCPDRHGTTPLLAAAEEGQTEIFKLLFAKYGHEQIKDIDGDGDTLLLLAVKGGETEMVQLVLDRGEEDINCRNNKGRTPLAKGVSNNREEVVRLLLKQPGIDVGIKDTEGETAIDTARRMGHESIVELLSTFSH